MKSAPAPQAFADARQRRAGLFAADTNCLRLINGETEGLPGILVDDFAGHWLVSTSGPAFPSWLLEVQGWTSLHHKILSREERGAPMEMAGTTPGGTFSVLEAGLLYEIDFTSGYSQGLFPDQRDNRARLRVWLGTRRNATVLNTFAYTCSFSVVGAAAGAATVSMDLSSPYLEWGRRNFARNGIDPAAHEFLRGDVFDWLRRFSRQGRRFDAVILDPPTFSRTKSGRVFRVESDYPTLVQLACACATDDAWILCTTNQRSLSPMAFRRLVRRGAPPGTRAVSHPMPPDFAGDNFLKSLILTPG